MLFAELPRTAEYSEKRQRTCSNSSAAAMKRLLGALQSLESLVAWGEGS